MVPTLSDRKIAKHTPLTSKLSVPFTIYLFRCFLRLSHVFIVFLIDIPVEEYVPADVLVDVDK